MLIKVDDHIERLEGGLDVPWALVCYQTIANEISQSYAVAYYQRNVLFE